MTCSSSPPALSPSQRTAFATAACFRGGGGGGDEDDDDHDGGGFAAAAVAALDSLTGGKTQQNRIFLDQVRQQTQ